MTQISKLELDGLKHDLLTMAAKVEDAVKKSIVAFYEYRTELAECVITEDRKVDRDEVAIEEKCLKLLGQHCLKGEDLRFVAMVLRINNDLERMADEAVAIARRATHLARHRQAMIPPDLKGMTHQVTDMVRRTLDTFVKKDAEAARKICEEDREVDLLNRKIIKSIRSQMLTDPDSISGALDVLTTTRRLERIADLATNIAENVVYMVEGQIIRHSGSPDDEVL